MAWTRSDIPVNQRAAPLHAGAAGSASVGTAVSGAARPADIAVLFLITLLASFTPIAVQAAVASFPPILGGVLRFAIASLILGVFLGIKRKLPRLGRRDFLRVALLGLVCVPINQFAFWGGVALANPSHSAMFYATTPVLVTIMVCVIGVEQWSLRVFLAAVLASAGVLAILIHSGLELRGRFFHGDLLLLLAALTWSGYLVFSRPLNDRYGSLATQFWVFLAGTLASIPLVGVQGFSVPWNHISWASWAGLFYLSVVVAVLVFFLFNWSMMRQPPSRVATFTNAAYPLTLVWEALINHRLPGIWFLLGSALLLAGMVLTLSRPRARVIVGEDFDPVAPGPVEPEHRET